ncbi:exodeoxyribonuclease VII large subunit, partial [bacterium AH-315-I18]|nr:exodeoxyribonuclease VII large subunit [bacterium AH-315-I18]
LSNRTHWFFSIKDQGATLRCVCFASNARKIKFPVRDGMEVIITGRVDFFEGQGSLQIYVDSMQQVGQGTLEQQLQEMIAQLRELGYLDVERKKQMPAMCQRIAVVTSTSAAALQDVINTAHRRWPGCELLHFDVRVQGNSAAPEIAKALRMLSDQGESLGIDAIILTRGGGSIEDLWAFNERIVADAVFDCKIPIVAAIGHETDTTVAELVADMRCATPTQAAMTLVPDRQALEHQVTQMTGRLKMSLQRQSQYAVQRLSAISKHRMFTRPKSLIEQPQQRLEHAKHRIGQALPGRVLPAKTRLQQVAERLPRVVQRRIEMGEQQIKSLSRTLNAVGPKRVLERGYSYTTAADGKLLRSVKDIQEGQAINTVLADGKFKSIVGDAGNPPAKPVKRKVTRRKSKSDGLKGAGNPGLFTQDS